MSVLDFKKLLAKLLNTRMVVESGTCEAFDFNSLYDTTIYEEPDGSKWLRIFHHSNPASNLFNSSDNFSTGVYKNENAWYNIENVCTSMNYFEFMVKQKDTAESIENKYRWIQNVDPIRATWAQVQPNNVTRITTEGYTSNSGGGLYVWANTNTGTNRARMSIANGTAENWYGAAGSWTPYNNGIPGFPDRTVTTGYMDIYIRYEPEYISKWTYRKWSDGTAECWCQKTLTGIVNTAWGSCYTGIPTTLNYPTNFFQSAPHVQIISEGDSGYASWVYCQTKGSATQTPQFAIIRATTGGTGNVTFTANIYAIGKWATFDSDSDTLNITGFSQQQMSKQEIQALIEASGNQFKDNDTWIPNDLG